MEKREIEVIEENEDEMKVKVKCPYCGKPTTFGELIMISGFYGCPNCYFVHGGLQDVVQHLKKNDYQSYVKGDFYSKGFEQNKADFLHILQKQ